MRPLVLFLLLVATLYPQTHGTFSAWSTGVTIPLAQSNASAGGGVPNTLVALVEAILFLHRTDPFGAGHRISRDRPIM
ncbi:MAG: hypothetical protein IPG53_21650 [Ignavibacteriales bacterium]|nr:hypothetical protein [Ignavibacteriales bacterium]